MTHLAGTIVLAILGLVAAVSDVRARRLPNWLAVVTAIAGLGFTMAAAGSSGIVWSGLHALVAIVIGAVLFRFGIIGGGDAKFYAACAAWLPLQSGLTLLLAVSLAGLLLVIVWFSIRRSMRTRSDPVEGKYAQVPYGVAIGFGAVAARVFF